MILVYLSLSLKMLKYKLMYKIFTIRNALDIIKFVKLNLYKYKV